MSIAYYAIGQGRHAVLYLMLWSHPEAEWRIEPSLLGLVARPLPSDGSGRENIEP